MPEHVRDEVRVEVDVAERHLTIVECRPPWRADIGVGWTRFPIARLRYVKTTTGVWSLYWRDRSLSRTTRRVGTARDRRSTLSRCAVAGR